MLGYYANPEAVVSDVKPRFVWESDGKLDSYKIMAAEGEIRGDCDDYAVTILYEIAGRSIIRFWWLLISFQAWIWYVKSPNDVPHATLWVRGAGYTDNWKDAWTKTETLHRRIMPLPWPIVLFKMIIGLFDKT